MIKVRCYRCGHAFHLAEQFVANDLAAQGVEGRPSHYVAECPQCRLANKVSLKRVRLPPPDLPEEPEPEAG